MELSVFVCDQHAGKKDGVIVDFRGHPAGMFKSLALIESENVSEAIRKNTQAFYDALGRMLLRHPEQWIWMHRRWKV